MQVGLRNHSQRQAPPRRHAEPVPAQESPSPQDAVCPSPSGGPSVGAVLLTGLALFGSMSCISPPPASAQELQVETPSAEICARDEMPVARAIVVDGFWNSENATTHGELVEGELVRLHDVEGEDANLVVERQEVSLWGGDHGLKDGKPGALQSHLRDHFAGRMNRDAKALRNILHSEGSRAVIHQSQGASQSRVVDGLYYRSLRDDSYRSRVQEQLGMDPMTLETEAQKAEFLGRLVKEAETMYLQDAEVQEARIELRAVQNELHQKGYIHVISAGNQGYLGRDMVKLGVETPSTFFVNEFASEHSIIVGASDNQSKGLESRRHTVASLASPNAGAHIAADGIDRPIFVDGKNGHHSGSSYAAPQVSSTILQMMRTDPDITRDQALAQLQHAATPMEGAEEFVGAGVLGAPEILLCDLGQ